MGKEASKAGKKQDPQLSQLEKTYRKKLKLRKFFLYLVVILATIVTLVLTGSIMLVHLIQQIRPQSAQAMIEMSQLLPQLDSDEEALRDAYHQMTLSRARVIAADPGLDMAGYEDNDEWLNGLIKNTLSWIERIRYLHIGRDGYVVVASKEDQTILSHQDDEAIGYHLSFLIEPTDAHIIKAADIDPAQSHEDLEVKLVVATVDMPVESFSDLGDILWHFIIGGVLEYKDNYLICGIPLSEVLDKVILKALQVTGIFLVILLLFVHYICLVLNRHKEEGQALRRKVLIYGVLAATLVFGLTSYKLVLEDLSYGVNDMRFHATNSAYTLNEYSNKKDEIDRWLDWEYLMQCRLVGDIVKAHGRDNLTREDMKRYANALGVKYIYVFDQNGKAVVTNAPYDHFEISRDVNDQSNAFLPLLQGLDHVIQAPMADDTEGSYLQYIGVSTRDEDDLSDGCVQIAVDTDLREQLTSALSVQKVLQQMTIGAPDYALAVDKEDRTVRATSGIDYPSGTADEYGLSKVMLKDYNAGTLTWRGNKLNYGIAGTDDVFIVSMAKARTRADSFCIAIYVGLMLFGVVLLESLIGFVRYQSDVVQPGNQIDSAKEDEEGPAKDKKSVAQKIIDQVNNDENDWGFINMLAQNQNSNRNLEERWGIDTTPPEQQTPEKRIGKIVSGLILVVCVCILLLQLLVRVIGPDSIMLSGLSYVVAGDWDKGFNIYAFTSCILLLCGIYVSVILAKYLLYQIARVSDTRVETVCLLIRNSLKYICAIVFVYYGLSQFGVDTKTLLTGVGLFTMMISFAAKDLVSDIIAGFFIIFEGTIQVGDLIRGGGWGGIVEEIGIRTTRIRNYSDVQIINNSSLKDFTNSSGGGVARKIIELPLPPTVDLEKVEAVLNEELPKLPDKIDGFVKPPKYYGVSALDGYRIVLRIAIFTEPRIRNKAYYKAQREIKLFLDKHGIARQ
ncbi:MAG: mechanosensitive ion channel family protein [Butyrivibrio sp.]|nr:mechanosensitive ion channel family protein [Butyrivibrio sp.]